MSKEIDIKIRKFLINELMKDQAEFISLDDELALDSLDQTELRGFLNEEYGIDTAFEKVPPESISTLKGIISLVS